MEMFNCFAYLKEKVCRVLVVDECMGENCPFFKTKRQFEEAAKRYDTRIKKKSRENLEESGDKYDR